MSARKHHGVPQPLPAHMLCRVEGVSDRFALTFDDGPSARHTPRALELLARHGAHATFFQLGMNVRRHPQLTRRVILEGHELGLHDHHHLPPPFLPAALFEREYHRAAQAVHAASGVRPRFYRPPFGVMTRAQADRVRAWGSEPVLGDLYPRDPERPGVQRIVERVLAGLRGGSILILHDASGFGDFDRGQTLEALGEIHVEASRLGLSAVSVGELVAHGASAAGGRGE